MLKYSPSILKRLAEEKETACQGREGVGGRAGGWAYGSVIGGVSAGGNNLCLWMVWFEGWGRYA